MRDLTRFGVAAAIEWTPCSVGSCPSGEGKWERQMIPILDFQRRSLRGKVMKAQDFDMSFAMKVREVIDRYGISFDPDQLIVDDQTADALFNAGVDLLAEVGLYQLDTQRVIEYTREEILAFAGERMADPARVTMGRGDDEVTLAYRTADEERPPTLYVGMAGQINEDELVPLMTCFAVISCE